MIRRYATAPTCFALFACLLIAGRASASVIGLPAPASGIAQGGTFTLNVDYDPNGTAAPNLVSMELFVGFTGFTPVPGSYALGSLFGDFTEGTERVSGDGECGVGCYSAFSTLFAPSVITSGGRLFSLQFSAAAGTAWTLDVSGDTDAALLTDPSPDTCLTDPNCVAIPQAIPFAVALANAPVNRGTARINVTLDGPLAGPPATTPVPEPATLFLLGSGVAAAAAKSRRRLRA